MMVDWGSNIAGTVSIEKTLHRDIEEREHG
jgi:hypothetical protein